MGIFYGEEYRRRKEARRLLDLLYRRTITDAEWEEIINLLKPDNSRRYEVERIDGGEMTVYRVKDLYRVSKLYPLR